MKTIYTLYSVQPSSPNPDVTGIPNQNKSFSSVCIYSYSIKSQEIICRFIPLPVDTKDMTQLIWTSITTLYLFYIWLISAEQELAKLQRQYRIIEGDRRAYSEETQNLIRKQM